MPDGRNPRGSSNKRRLDAGGSPRRQPASIFSSPSSWFSYAFASRPRRGRRGPRCFAAGPVASTDWSLLGGGQADAGRRVPSSQTCPLQTSTGGSGPSRGRSPRPRSPKRRGTPCRPRHPHSRFHRSTAVLQYVDGKGGNGTAAPRTRGGTHAVTQHPAGPDHRHARSRPHHPKDDSLARRRAAIGRPSRLAGRTPRVQSVSALRPRDLKRRGIARRSPLQRPRTDDQGQSQL